MEGQVACAQGRRAESLAAHEAAADLCARLGLRPFWARFRLDWAAARAAHREPSDRERAQELLRESLAAFEEMGLPRYAAVAQQRLDELEEKQMREPAEQRWDRKPRPAVRPPAPAP